MAKTSATISVGADTRQLERDIQRALGRDFKFKALNERAFTQPLGRITGAANEFQKSLDASNARVIAFGASAGLIYSVERAFSALVKSTIDVQKSLTDINVILNVSNKTLQNFGGQLFDIAKNTAQSFDTVAQAATEFSRQGLGLEETLKRTRDALILTRLSGLDTVSAVEALTATINSFSNAALDSTTIINKLANVDAAFAVSSADLAEAIKRVGSSAQDVGVDFDELLAIVTSVQQTTARGGAVIGNSLKTIFTRIQRTDTLDQLEELGIQVRNLEGETLPAITILSNLARTFATLGDAQRAQVAESVGGVFQINILKAALGDLQKEYSVYNNALRTASGATDEAIQRNEALNQTLSALINKTFVNLTKVGADIGRISFQPTFENLLNTLNKGLESLDVEAKTTGGKIAKGILEGIGTFIGGPGVVLATAVIGKLVINLGKFAAQSLQTLLNLNTQAEQRAQIQTKINQVLAQEPALVAAVYNKQISVLDVENKILNIIRQQTLERERAASISTTIAGGLLSKGVSSKGGTLKAKSGGFIPNFAISEIFGALAGGYNPGNIKRMSIPGEGLITYNSAEKVKRFSGLSQPAIMPPSQSPAGKNYKGVFSSIHGFNPYAFDGFVPNFGIKGADLPLSQGRLSSLSTQILQNKNPDLSMYTTAQREQLNREVARRRLGGTVEYNASKLGLVGVTGSRGPFNPSTTFAQLGFPNDPRSVRFTGIQGRTIGDLRNNALSQKGEFSRSINSLFANPLKQLASTIFGKVNPDKKFLNLLQSSGRGNINLFPPGTEGSIFEAAVNLATKKGTGALEKAFNQDLAQKPFDFEESGSPSQQFNRTFGFTPFVTKADAKRTVDTDSAREIIQKAYQIGSGVGGLPKPINKKIASQGFIPNFTALNDAIDREISAGVSPSRVRIGKDKRLTSAYNPLGLGVYNTKDEPLGLGQGVSRSGSKAKMAGASKGFIPNFVVPLAAGGGTVLFLLRSVLSAALFVAIDKLGQKIQQSIQDERGKVAAEAGVGGLSYALPTLLAGGGKKAAGGAFLAGAVLSLVNSLNTLDQSTKDLIAASEDSKDVLQEFSSDSASYAQNLEKLKDETISSSERQKILSENSDKLASILLNTPNDLKQQLKDAVASGNPEGIVDALNKVQVALQVSATNADKLTKITQITADKSIKPEELARFSSAIAGLQTQKGTTLAAEVMRNPALLEQFKASMTVPLPDVTTVEKIASELVKEKYGYNEFGFDPRQKGPYQKISPERMRELRQGVYPEAIKRYGEMQRQEQVNRISGGLEGLLTGAGINPQVVKIIGEQFRSIPFDDASKQAEFLTKALEELGLEVVDTSEGLKVQKRYREEDFLRRAGQIGDVSASGEALNKFRENLDPESLGMFSSTVLDADKSLKANIISTKQVLELQKGLRTEILNETERRSTEAKYIAKVSELLNKSSGDLDKFSLALQGSQEEIILESKRRRGLMFAEDYRNSRQAAREKRILGGDTQLGDFGAAFFDEFDYRAEDAYRDIQLGAKETARTIKSEFNNAFFDFAQGSATAGQAFEKFALNISNKIQQLAFEFSTNAIFGALFGSQSSLITKLAGSLGKSKGGIIKGYSSGGNVTGGSGTKDDVPAMLSNGEYVIRKSAVNKYGSAFLGMLNAGVMPKFANGGELQFLGENVYRYNDAFYPTAGQNVIDPRLSFLASIDPNNPQNQIRQERESELINYINYVEGVNEQNRIALQENIKLNQEIQDQYNRQRRQASQGAWFSFLLGIAGAGASQFSSMGGFSQFDKQTSSAVNLRPGYKSPYEGQTLWSPSDSTGRLRLGRSSGGEIKRFASGGSSRDDIPALLMGGEFVMRKEAVNLYGKRFFDNLNSGRIKKFATGGEVGNSINSNGMESYSPTNNVNVTVNLNQETAEPKPREETTAASSREEEARRARELGEKVKQQVIKVITEQQRPGGLLSSKVYRKIG